MDEDHAGALLSIRAHAAGAYGSAGDRAQDGRDPDSYGVAYMLVALDGHRGAAFDAALRRIDRRAVPPPRGAGPPELSEFLDRVALDGLQLDAGPGRAELLRRHLYRAYLEVLRDPLGADARALVSAAYAEADLFERHALRGPGEWLARFAGRLARDVKLRVGLLRERAREVVESARDLAAAAAAYASAPAARPESPPPRAASARDEPLPGSPPIRGVEDFARRAFGVLRVDEPTRAAAARVLFYVNACDAAGLEYDAGALEAAVPACVARDPKWRALGAAERCGLFRAGSRAAAEGMGGRWEIAHRLAPEAFPDPARRPNVGAFACFFGVDDSRRARDFAAESPVPLSAETLRAALLRAA